MKLIQRQKINIYINKKEIIRKGSKTDKVIVKVQIVLVTKIKKQVTDMKVQIIEINTRL